MYAPKPWNLRACLYVLWPLDIYIHSYTHVHEPEWLRVMKLRHIYMLRRLCSILYNEYMDIPACLPPSMTMTILVMQLNDLYLLSAWNIVYDAHIIWPDLFASQLPSYLSVFLYIWLPIPVRMPSFQNPEYLSCSVVVNTPSPSRRFLHHSPLYVGPSCV